MDLAKWRFSFSGGLGKQLKYSAGDELFALRIVSSDGTSQWFVNLTPGRTAPDGSAVYGTQEADVKSTLIRLADSAGWLLQVPNGYRYHFGLNAEIRKVTTRNGLSHTYSYSGFTTTITDDFGRSLDVVTNGARGRGRVESVTLPDGSTLQYSYTADGTLGTVTLADGTTREHHYEQNPGQLTGITDERGIRYSTYTYSENIFSPGSFGRVTASEHSGGAERTTFSRLSDGVKIVNPLGKESIFKFVSVEGSPKLSSIEQQPSEFCPGAASAYTYDDNGFIETKTDWNGTTTRYQRNDRGLAETTTLAAGTLEERVINTVWHPLYRIPRIITEPGRTTELTFDSVYTPLFTGKKITDLATGQVREWAYTYNDLGQLVTIDGPRTDVSDVTSFQYYDCTTGGNCGQLHTVTNPVGHVVTFNAYDPHGNPTRITDANGIATELVYDQRQRLVSISVDGNLSTIAYDPTGQVKRSTQADGTYVEYMRDSANRLIGMFDSQGNRIDWSLDAAGNRIDEQIRDPQGVLRKRMRFKYDELSRLRKTIFTHSGEVTYSHDNNGNRTGVTDDGNLDDGVARVFESQYDSLNRLIKDIDPLAGQTLYTYDSRDNLTVVTDAKGLSTSYSYSGFDDLLQLVSPDTGTTDYSYDEAGNLKIKTDARGVSASYSYDALNRLIGISYPDSSEDIGYIYDEGENGIGRLSQFTDHSGSTTYSYDTRGNVTGLLQVVGTSSYSMQFAYNNANRLTGMTYPSGRTVSFTLDDIGQARRITSVSSSGTETLADSITRLPFGPVKGLTLGNGVERVRSFDQDYRVEQLADGSLFDRAYALNAVNNITAITDAVNSNDSQFFRYDNLDRLDFAIGAYGENSYGYDPIGNRLSANHASESHSYQYGSESHRLQSVGQLIYQYDATGNTTNNGVASFSYNNRNRLTSVTVDAVTTQYRHNALGQRVVKNSTGTGTHYLYDLDGRLIAEAQDGEVTVEYSYIDGEPLTMWKISESSVQPTEPPAEPVLLEPVGTIETFSPEYVWAHTSSNTQYRLRIYDRTQRRWVVSTVYDSAEICDAESCRVKPDLELPYSRNHLGQLRARNVVGWSGWSEYRRFHVVPALPDQPQLIGPEGNIDTASPVYRWAHQSGNTRYRLQIYNRIARRWQFNELIDPAQVCHESSCELSPTLSLPDSRNHIWRVRARNLAGWSPWSARSYFHVTAATQPESLLDNGGFESGLTSWISCSDAGSTQIVADAQEGTQAAQLTGGDCLYQEFTVAPGRDYTMACQAKGGHGQYADITISLMDSSYVLLVAQEVPVNSEGFDGYSASLSAPAIAAIGAVTLYSEEPGIFDNCQVVVE